MNNEKKIVRSLKILNQIQKVRSKNNKNWMDILRLSIQLDYNKTSKLIKSIYEHDTKISRLAKKIYTK
jgi:hypothetical protein